MALVVIIALGIPIMYATAYFCYAVLHMCLTVGAARPELDEEDGMYVNANGKVRVDN